MCITSIDDIPFDVDGMELTPLDFNSALTYLFTPSTFAADRCTPYEFGSIGAGVTLNLGWRPGSNSSEKAIKDY